MATGGRAGQPDVPVRFEAEVWDEEVSRLRPGSAMRQAAEAARARLEAEPTAARWLACEAERPGQPRLPRCLKLYLPLGREPSAAPYGFVFELVASREPEAAVLASAACVRGPKRVRAGPQADSRPLPRRVERGGRRRLPVGTRRKP